MTTGITDFGAARWLPVLVGALDPPAGFYVALLVDEPSVTDDGDILADLEPDPAAGYARQVYSAGPDWWNAADNNVVNSQYVAWPNQAADDWGLITHYALCTAATGGDVYGWGEFLNPANILAGASSISIPPGGLVLAMFSLDPTIAV